MNEPYPAQIVLEELLERLQFCVGGADKAYGEVEGSPVTMTVLGHEPLALLLGFKIQTPHPEQIKLPSPIAWRVGEKKAEVVLENGLAWFSLDDLTGETSESIDRLIRSFAEALGQAKIRLPEGCVQCRSTDDVALVYADGRCSRLCAHCRDLAVGEHVKREVALNRGSFWHALALPLIFVYVSIAWMLLWWLVDMALIWSNTDRIVLGHYEFMVIFVVLAVIAGVTGYPIGIFLRRSGIPGRTHWIASTFASCAACVAGEWLYVVTVVYRLTGVFELILPIQLVTAFITGYHPTWMAGKLIAAIAIGIGCHAGAKWRTATVRI